MTKLQSSLDELRVQFTEQQHDIERLRVYAGRESHPARLRRSGTGRRFALVTGLIGVLALAPALVLGTIGFSDVPPTNPFYNDIQAIANAGVTTGCGGGKYCPKDYVTREQMAAFMNRLGALSAGKTPVVNAAELDGITAAGFLQVGDFTVRAEGPWEANGSTAASSLARYTNTTYVNATGSGTYGVQLGLNAPSTIVGVHYGVKSVRVCFDASSGGANLPVAVVTQATDTLTSTNLASDTSGHSMASAGCVTLTPTTLTTASGPVSLYVAINFSSAGTAKLTSTTTVWSPTYAIAAPTASRPGSAGTAPR